MELPPSLGFQCLSASFAIHPNAMNELELGSFDEFCGFKMPSAPVDDGHDNSNRNDNSSSNSNDSNDSNNSNTANTLSSSSNNNTPTPTSNDMTNNDNNNNNSSSPDMLPPTPCEPKVPLSTTDEWYWDPLAQLAQLTQAWNNAQSQATPGSAAALTPELSPATSSFTPSTLDTPLGFDGVGLAEISSSPVFEFDPSFDITFGITDDFLLFPDQPTKATSDSVTTTTAATTATAVATTTTAATTTIAPPATTLVPVELSQDPLAGLYTPIKTESFVVAKALGAEVTVPQAGVAPRKPTQSPTKPGFQPNKRRRRRRITSEEAARVIPEENKDDPNAKARYKCFVCNKTFSRPYNLRSHRKIHEGVKPYVCSHLNADGQVCAWAFARRHDLERHISSRHSADKVFTCMTCGKTCSRSDAYKKHVDRHRASNQQPPLDAAAADQENKVSYYHMLGGDFESAEEY